MSRRPPCRYARTMDLSAVGGSPIAPILTAPNRLPFRARVREIFPADEQLFDVETIPSSGSWLLRNLRTQSWQRYTPEKGRERWSNGRLSALPNGARPPFAVRLGFPNLLPVWGRPQDEYEPTTSMQRDGLLVVELRSRRIPDVDGELTIDLVRGSCVRLRRADSVLEALEINYGDSPELARLVVSSTRPDPFAAAGGVEGVVALLNGDLDAFGGADEVVVDDLAG